MTPPLLFDASSAAFRNGPSAASSTCCCLSNCCTYWSSARICCSPGSTIFKNLLRTEREKMTSRCREFFNFFLSTGGLGIPRLCGNPFLSFWRRRRGFGSKKKVVFLRRKRKLVRGLDRCFRSFRGTRHTFGNIPERGLCTYAMAVRNERRSLR